MTRTLSRLFAASLLIVATACSTDAIQGGAQDIGREPVDNDNGKGNGSTLAPFITDGQKDFGHESVGKLYSGGGACSATLVGKRTVLTAGHCVRSGSTRFVLGSKTYYATQIIRHPSYGGGNRDDVALVILRDIPSGVTASPIATSAPRTGQAITLVGFGRTGENTNDYGTKRMARNTVSSVGSTIFSFRGTGSVCNGDSGGPTFVEVNGVEVVAGVHSTKSGACGWGGNDMRVDAYRQWIETNARGDVVLQGSGSTPAPTQPNPPTPASKGAQEGQSCATTACAPGLTCVGVYSGGTLIGKYCMEGCRTLGADPNCDGDEQCAQSSKGRVCFNPKNPKGGFTSNSPGANGGTQPQPPKDPTPPPPAGGACGSADESGVLDLLNKERAANGMGPLSCDATASKVAREHSQDMCNQGYFSHTGLDGSRPWDRLRRGGVSFRSAGENIAKGYSSAQSVHNGWMNSSGHRANMLNPSWTRVGIGMVRCNGGTPIWTEVFMY